MNDNKDNDTIWAVMLFDTEINLKISNTPNKWFNYHTEVFDNPLEALDYYANIPCPASQLISAPNEEEIAYKSAEMIENYQNDEWLNENLYPFL